MQYRTFEVVTTQATRTVEGAAHMASETEEVSKEGIDQALGVAETDLKEGADLDRPAGVGSAEAAKKVEAQAQTPSEAVEVSKKGDDQAAGGMWVVSRVGCDQAAGDMLRVSKE